MTIGEIVEQAKALNRDERRDLIKQLIDLLDEEPIKRSIQDFRGVGAHMYDGTDAQDYVNQLRAD